jgi:UDP-N-acetylmuramate dehydrogenase
VLGGGSNLLVPDAGFAGLVLHMAIGGVERDGCTFRVGAGENWDAFVDIALAANCGGVECMAGIPGSVGGTPVQNVGAYGQEVAETIVEVRAFDRTTGDLTVFDNAACEFRYRESLFNTTARGRYIVTQVTFQLRADAAPQLRYADLARRFADVTHTPTLAEVAAAVRDIRHSKGMLIVPGEADCRSAGSFFKNPIVPAALLAQIADAEGIAAEAVPHWAVAGGRVKLPAAWLLEHAGFVKGYGEGAVGISSRHTLALVNRGGATFADVAALQQEIVERVHAKFGVTLEREPVLMA